MIEPRLIQAVETLIQRHERPGHVPLIAISGAQGSGKSTLAAQAARSLSCATLSLDDVYLTRAERAGLAGRVHPLFAVRGPPGTHDLSLLHQTLDRLRSAAPGDRTALPLFDKRSDDRRPVQDWPVVQGQPRAILLEGWCLGATAQTAQALSVPVNALERDHDPDGLWRRAANTALGDGYARLFANFDAVLFLRAPDFRPVLDWRIEQEAGLTGVPVATVPVVRRTELSIFIQHFERITRHMLADGIMADIVVELDADRVVRQIRSGDGA